MPNEINIVVKAKEQGLDEVDKRIKGIGETAKGILTADFMQQASQGAQEFVRSTVQAASNLGESVNAVQKIFGENSKEILKWGETNSEAMGLSQRAFNEAIVPLGSLLKNTGMGMGEVSMHTLDLTQRAADMASVFNTSVPDALEAIQAGLRGESDPLERYGVSLSAAAVQAEALSETHKKAAGELTNTELATARVNLIMKQTSSTAGDFASTSNGLANSQRIAAAQIEDAKAKIGEGLLPVLAKAAQLAGEAAGFFGKLPGPIQQTALIVGVLGASFVILAPRIMAAKNVLDELRGASIGTSNALSLIGKATAAVTILVAVFEAMKSIADASEKAPDSIQKTERALQTYAEQGKATTDTLKHLDVWFQTIAKSSGTLGTTAGGHFFEEAKKNIGELDKAMADMVSNGQADMAARAYNALAAEAFHAGLGTDDLKKLLPQYGEAVANAGHQTQVAAQETDKAAAAYDALGEKLKGVKNPIDAVTSTFDAIMGVDKATLGFAESQTKLTEAVKQNGHELDIHKEKGQQNRDAVLSAVAANVDLYGANVASGMSAVDAAAKYDENTRALESQLRAAGFTAAQVDGLIGKYRGIPSKVATIIAMDGLTRAIDDLADLIRQINNIPRNKTIDVGVNFHYSQAQLIAKGTYAHGGVVGAAASGGPRSDLTLVGEQGPELVDLPAGSTVHSAPDTARLLAGSNAGVVFAPNITVNALDPRAAATAVWEALVEYTRTAGPIPARMVAA